MSGHSSHGGHRGHGAYKTQLTDQKSVKPYTVAEMAFLCPVVSYRPAPLLGGEITWSVQVGQGEGARRQLCQLLVDPTSRYLRRSITVLCTLHTPEPLLCGAGFLSLLISFSSTSLKLIFSCHTKKLVPYDSIFIHKFHYTSLCVCSSSVVSFPDSSPLMVPSL